MRVVNSRYTLGLDNRDYNAQVAKDGSTIRIYGTDRGLSGFYAGSQRFEEDFDKTFQIGDVARIEWGDNGNIVKITVKTVTIKPEGRKAKRLGLYNFIMFNVKDVS